MSLRGFFIWFWGIVLGGAAVAGTTLAVLKAPVGPPAPAALPTAVLQPLPPAPPLPAPRREAAAWPPMHPTVIRPALRPRHTVRLAERFAAERIIPERITVVPPIPPEPELHALPALRAPVERRLRMARFAGPHRMARVETRTRIVTEEVNPEPPRPQPEPRAYSWYPGYPRYSFDAYAYPYPSGNYPPRYAYFYRY